MRSRPLRVGDESGRNFSSTGGVKALEAQGVRRKAKEEEEHFIRKDLKQLTGQRANRQEGDDAA